MNSTVYSTRTALPQALPAPGRRQHSTNSGCVVVIQSAAPTYTTCPPLCNTMPRRTNQLLLCEKLHQLPTCVNIAAAQDVAHSASTEGTCTSRSKRLRISPENTTTCPATAWDIEGITTGGAFR